MKKMSILSFLVLAFACDQNNDFVTESGTEVTVLTKGDGGQPQPDSILLLHLKMATAEGEVLMESSEEKPLPVPYSDTLQAGHLQELRAHHPKVAARPSSLASGPGAVHGAGPARLPARPGAKWLLESRAGTRARARTEEERRCRSRVAGWPIGFTRRC
ncbi:MAG: hypothetical protein KY428_10765, partial [Bacteroidetes bacterium]|nr:hypothetical protein [Bacteroidota bacterium]